LPPQNLADTSTHPQDTFRNADACGGTFPSIQPLSGVNKLQHMTAAFDNCKWLAAVQVFSLSFVVSLSGE